MVEFEDSDHRLVVGQFEEFANGTITARKLWEKCRAYKNGNQYTPTERAKIEKRQQPVITDNKIQDKCNTLMGIEKQMRTDPKASPRNPSDEDESSAEAATLALRYISDDNNYKMKARKGAADNLMVEGVCFGQVIIDKDYGNQNVCIERIRQDRGYYDIRSLEDDFSDKRYCGYFTWMDYAEVLEEYPNAKDVLETSDGSGWADESGQSLDDKPRYILTQSKRKRVQIFTHWHIKTGKWYESKWCRGGFLEKPKVCVYRDEYKKPMCPMEIQALYRDSEGHPYGEVPRYLDLQDEHNKRRSKMLHLLNSKRIIIRRGAGPTDEEGGINSLRAEVHKPDGLIEINGDPADIRIEDNLNEAEGQWRLLQQTDAALSTTGPNAAIAGVSGDISGIAKARDQQAGQLPISPLFDALDSWELRIFRQAWMRARQFWKSEMWVRVTDNEDAPRWVGLNQPVTNGEQAAKKLRDDPQFMALPDDQKLAQIQAISQHPDAQLQAIDDKTGGLLKRNVPAEIDVDIIIDRAPDVSNLQQETFATLSELAKTRPEVSFKTLVKLAGVPYSIKREVLDELKNSTNPAQVQQAMQQVQMMGEQLQQAQGELQKQAQEIEKAKAELQTEAANLRTEQADLQTDKALLQTARAEFDAHIAQQNAGLAQDQVKFQGKQLDDERAKFERATVASETEQQNTGGLIQQLGDTLAAFQEQLQQLALQQQASAEQTQQVAQAAQALARKGNAQFRITPGAKGRTIEKLEPDESGQMVVTGRHSLERDGKGGYNVTVQ